MERKIIGQVLPMKKIFLVICGFLALALARANADATNPPPVRIAIWGLVHGHVHGFIPRVLACSDVQLVGIIEPNRELAARCAATYKLSTNLFHASLEDLLAKTNAQAVAAFTSTYDHERVVEACAPHGIHVMMEKPLAVNLEHARAIEAAVKKGGIQLIVNYETTWYPGNQAAYKMVWEQNTIGEIRKIVVHDGHPGPKEIGCAPEFLEWLTDPKLGGGGALMDFGCYGADMITWLMQGQRPTSVFAVTQHIKPELYPKVDDEATIVVTYPKAQGIIQASWNWPYNRKDMEIYGKSGFVLVPRSDSLRVLQGMALENETAITPPPLTGATADPVSYLAAVVRGDIKPSGLSSLEVNMIAMEILEAARESARTGKRVDLGNTKIH
jgi:predicted dehydrogenase